MELTEEQQREEEQKRAAEDAANTIVVGGRKLDLRKLPPFTIRDRIAFKKQHGVDPQNLRNDPEMEARFVQYALLKLDTSVTLDETLDLPYAQAVKLTSTYITRGIVDRPT